MSRVNLLMFAAHWKSSLSCSEQVILLSRSGKVLDSDPEARPETCQAALRGVNPKMLPVVFGVSFVKMT